jgi:hypothetical protein
MVIAIYMALVGYGVMVGIPVISTAWVSLLGFSEVQVGRVAGADLGGFSVGAILVSLFVARINRRYLVVAAVAIGANMFSLHAGVSCEGNQRNKRERLCRYIARPAVAVPRLSLSSTGKVVYTLKTPYRDGTRQVAFDPANSQFNQQGRH